MYSAIKDIDFSIVTNGWRNLIFFDDMFLNMQGMNIGISDSVITEYEYSLLSEYIEIERTPTSSAMLVSAFSQMWVFAVYELLRLWRDRIYKFRMWQREGGLNIKINNLSDDELNLAKNVRRSQLIEFRDNETVRHLCDVHWELINPYFLRVELYRMNLAKHAAPGNNNQISRFPSYGRINMLCGAMDFEVSYKDGSFETINRRDIADSLREMLSKLNNTL